MIKLIRSGKKVWVDLNRRETRRRKQLNRTRRTRPGSRLYLYEMTEYDPDPPTIYLVTGYSRHYRRYSARVVAMPNWYVVKKHRKDCCMWPYVIWLNTLNTLKWIDHRDLVLYTHLKHGNLFNKIISGQYKRLER